MNTQRKRKNCARISKEAVVGSLVVETDAMLVGGVPTLAAAAETTVSAVPANSVITGIFAVCKNPNTATGVTVTIGAATVLVNEEDGPAVYIATADETSVLSSSLDADFLYIEETTDVVVTTSAELTRGAFEIYVEFYELDAKNGMRVQP